MRIIDGVIQEFSTNWLVRAYRDGHEITSWAIESRTEREAESQAITDIARLGDCLRCDDWTLTETQGLHNDAVAAIAKAETLYPRG